MTRRASKNTEGILRHGSAAGSRLLALGLAVGLWLGTQLVAAQEAGPSEQQVKAAFLLNFPKYVNWPPECNAGSNEPIVLGIFGDTGLEAELRKMVKGKAINNRPVTVKHVGEAESISDCQLLFISASAQQSRPKILESLKQAGVLTVGDSDDFLKAGGMIRLVRRGQRIRLEVDVKAARTAHLQISSKLLAVADVVKDNEN